MCEPATLALAAAGVAAVGKGVGALQSAATSRYQARVADRNASLAAGQANDAATANRLEAQRFYRQAGQRSGQQVAAMAANGLDLGFGNALGVQQDSAMITAEDVGQIYRKGNEDVRGFDINAGNYRAQAQGARQAASGALVKGVFDVASTALGGAEQYKRLKVKSA
jgi:hypothetical protein